MKTQNAILLIVAVIIILILGVIFFLWEKTEQPILEENPIGGNTGEVQGEAHTNLDAALEETRELRKQLEAQQEE